MHHLNTLSETIINLIAQIPVGKVATYGQIAVMAGNPRAARQVSRLLHSCSKKYQLPWHRIINSQGKISIPKDLPQYQEQLNRLLKEGVELGLNNRIDLSRYQWQGTDD